MLLSGASAGSTGAARFSIAALAISIACARVNCGVPRRADMRRERASTTAAPLAKIGAALHERRGRLAVAEHAEAAEHLRAEPVGGCDRGGVEVGERGGEPLAAEADLVRRAGGEELRDLVALRWSALKAGL